MYIYNEKKLKTLGEIVWTNTASGTMLEIRIISEDIVTCDGVPLISLRTQ